MAQLLYNPSVTSQFPELLMNYFKFIILYFESQGINNVVAIAIYYGYNGLEQPAEKAAGRLTEQMQEERI